MPEKIQLNKIDPMEAIYAVNATLRRIDIRLVDHGERVAYLAHEMCKIGNVDMDQKTLFLLSSFHDIGAYKTEEIDNMLQFESKNVQNHAIYGYLFMKYLTPLSKCAEAILYHHSSWKDIENANIAYGEYAAMIHLADRLDVILASGKNPEDVLKYLEKYRKGFKEEYFLLAKKLMQDENVFLKMQNGSYHEENIKLCETFHPSTEEAMDYLKMIVYSIDFRSDHTVTHTINTVSIALNIARYFKRSENEMEDIYIGALLHDIGKIAIPLDILESPGKLSDEEMTVMRTHVKETEKLIKGIVPDSICQIALRHHEKLDGSGYPKGLSEKELTFPQRIVAVADIVSALSSRRSYKEPFPKEKTLAIIGQMSGGQLDSQICQYIMDNYDKIMQETEASRINVIKQYQKIQKEYQKMIK